MLDRSYSSVRPEGVRGDCGGGVSLRGVLSAVPNSSANRTRPLSICTVCRDDTAYVLDRSPAVERAEGREQRDNRTVLTKSGTNETLAAAAATGMAYESPLGPPRRAS